MKPCHFHPNREPVTYCSECGKAVCAECVAHDVTPPLCVECVAGATAEPDAGKDEAAAARPPEVTITEPKIEVPPPKKSSGRPEPPPMESWKV